MIAPSRMITLFGNADRVVPCRYRVRDVGPVDVTGANIRARVKRKVVDTAPLLEVSTENGAISVVDGPAGLFQITFTGEAVLAALGGEAALSDLIMDVVVTLPAGRPVNVGRLRLAMNRGT